MVPILVSVRITYHVSVKSVTYHVSRILTYAYSRITYSRIAYSRITYPRITYLRITYPTYRVYAPLILHLCLRIGVLRINVSAHISRITYQKTRIHVSRIHVFAYHVSRINVSCIHVFTYHVSRIHVSRITY